jgi:hypothetical protein
MSEPAAVFLGASQLVLLSLVLRLLWRVERLAQRASQDRLQRERDALFSATGSAAEMLEIVAGDLLWSDARTAQDVARAAKSLRGVLAAVEKR